VENALRAQVNLVAKCVLMNNMPSTHRFIPLVNIFRSAGKPKDFVIYVVGLPILVTSVANLAESRFENAICSAEWIACKCGFLNEIAILVSFAASRWALLFII